MYSGNLILNYGHHWDRRKSPYWRGVLVSGIKMILKLLTTTKIRTFYCHFFSLSPLHDLLDVYIKIWLLNKGRRIKKWKSSIKQKIPAPIFNEPFAFDLGSESADFSDIALELVVMEQDRFSRGVTMGVVYIGTSVPHHTGRQHWRQVMSQSGTRISNWHPVLPISPSTL